MKTIVIAGAGSNTGKTAAAEFLESVMPKSFVIKLGEGVPQEENRIPLFPVDAEFDDFSDTIPPETEYLIIESGRIAKKISADCLIYMDLSEESASSGEETAGATDSKRSRKESTLWLLEKADLVSGKKITCRKAWEIADRLGIQKQLVGKILNFLKIKVIGCQLGLF